MTLLSTLIDYSLFVRNLPLAGCPCGVSSLASRRQDINTTCCGPCTSTATGIWLLAGSLFVKFQHTPLPVACKIAVLALSLPSAVDSASPYHRRASQAVSVHHSKLQSAAALLEYRVVSCRAVLCLIISLYSAHCRTSCCYS